MADSITSEVSEMRKVLIILGLVGAVAAIAVVGTAMAQTPTPTPGQARANYQDFFLDRLAANLGVTRDQLTKAFTQARNDTADQAVKDGKLTQQQADRLKQQQGFAPFGPGFHGFKRGAQGGPALAFLGPARDAVAQALGMTPEELMSQLRSGKPLGQLAQGKEQAVKDALKNSMKPKLDQAVKNGRMTQEQANQALDRIQNLDLNQIGGGPGMDRGRHQGGNGKQKPAPGSRPSMGPAPSWIQPLSPRGPRGPLGSRGASLWPPETPPSSSGPSPTVAQSS